MKISSMLFIAVLLTALAGAQELPLDKTISIESGMREAPRELIKERLAEQNLTVQQVKNMTTAQKQELRENLTIEKRELPKTEMQESKKQPVTEYLPKLRQHKREMTLDDLRDSDLKKLKLTHERMEEMRKEGKLQLKKIRQQHKKMQAKEMLKHERMQKHLKELRGKMIDDVELDVDQYEVTVDGVTLNKTRFVIAAPAEKRKRDMDFLVEIPKSITANASDIDFDIEPEILEEDPVVKWAFQNLPQKEAVEYGFTVDGDVQNFDDLAVVAAEHQSILQRIANFFLNLFG